jgi:RNA polymerase sigma-70 factor (ECF subfamily)
MEPLAATVEHLDARERDSDECFADAVQIAWPRVFRFALASLRNYDAAEALTQDCFLRAHAGWKRFRGDCSIQTWLMQIAVNLVRDAARNRRLQFWRRVQTTARDLAAVSNWIPDRRLSPEAEALLKERVAAMWKATEVLPERQRTVFLLRFGEDMDLLEIAAATGLTEGAVKVHLFRAVQSVRERTGRS